LPGGRVSPRGAIAPDLPLPWIPIRRHKSMVRASHPLATLSQTGQLTSDLSVRIGPPTNPDPDGRDRTDGTTGMRLRISRRSAPSGPSVRADWHPHLPQADCRYSLSFNLDSTHTIR
jgi:hypothetical protein